MLFLTLGQKPLALSLTLNHQQRVYHRLLFLFGVLFKNVKTRLCLIY